MKVSIAVKTLGSALAAAIETLVDCGKNIPTEAIETACFIQKDVNNLFESFNSTGIPVNTILDIHAPLQRILFTCSFRKV
jgi:hypothetical protein